MTAIFLKVADMSASACFLIAAVMLLRPALTKAPRYVRCLLWAMVGIKLLCPISIESAMSIIPAQIIDAQAVQFGGSPVLNTGFASLDGAVNNAIASSMPHSPAASADPLYLLAAVLSAVWLLGAAAMAAYTLIACLRLRRRVAASVRLDGNVYICDDIDTPFILGVIRPRIYLPSSLDDTSRENVLLHEREHSSRRDHWWKPLGFLILALHWFNPLVWAAYILLCRDLELACDEKIIAAMSDDEKKSYSETLLACSTGRGGIAACPLAFGEVGVKERVKTVQKYKKPSIIVVAAALLICAVTAGCFMTDPPEEQESAPVADDIVSESPTPEDAKPPYGDTVLESAINKAILDENAGSGPEGSNFACCSYIPLKEVESDDGHKVTCYGWAYYGEYAVSESGIELMSGSHVPVALTFSLGSGAISLEEYWTPGDGERFASSIEEKFPADIADEAMDSQRYVMSQIQACYDQAVRECGLDTGPIISELIEKICSAQPESSPEAMIENSPIEYRELLCYGQYTVDYCMERFAAGGETGAEGYIMAVACSELLDSPIGDAETGQAWYDAYMAK